MIHIPALLRAGAQAAKTSVISFFKRRRRWTADEVTGFMKAMERHKIHKFHAGDLKIERALEQKD